MSGTGKTTLIEELVEHGYKAIETDDDEWLTVERIPNRSNNPYGKDPDERAEILGYVQSVEPRLRKTATLEVDTSLSIDQVVQIVLNHVLPSTEQR